MDNAEQTRIAAPPRKRGWQDGGRVLERWLERGRLGGPCVSSATFLPILTRRKDKNPTFSAKQARAEDEIEKRRVSLAGLGLHPFRLDNAYGGQCRELRQACLHK